MSGPTDPVAGSEAFGTACGLAVVVGAMSVVVPALDVLVAAMTALALAGWASLHRGRRLGSGSRRRRQPAYAVAFSAIAVAALLYMDPPTPLAPWHALGLGLATVPLWTVERRRARRPGEARG